MITFKILRLINIFSDQLNVTEDRFTYFSPFSISVVAVAVASTFSAHAGKFNPEFLEDVQGVGQHVDLTMFEKGQEQQLPGIYRVSVYVNEQRMETRTLEFKEATEAPAQSDGE